MHSGTVQQGDAWLQANLAPVLSSPWFTNYPSTVIVTMDEGDGSANAGSCCSGGGSGGPYPDGGHLVSHATAKGNLSAPVGDLYGMLRSIEEAFGVAVLGSAGNPVNSDFLSLFG